MPGRRCAAPGHRQYGGIRASGLRWNGWLRVQVHLPAGLEPIYSNFALITNSPSEIVVDFAQIMPQVTQARIRARVVMTPLNAKLVLKALTDHLARY